MGSSARLTLGRQRHRADEGTVALLLVALAVAAVAWVVLAGLALIASDDSRSWVGFAGVLVLPAGWTAVLAWWRRHPDEGATSRRVGRRFLVAGWSLWLLLAGSYVAATVAATTTGDDVSMEWV